MREDLIKIAQEYIPVLESTGVIYARFSFKVHCDEDEVIRVALTLVKSDDDWGVSLIRFDAVGKQINELDLG